MCWTTAGVPRINVDVSLEHIDLAVTWEWMEFAQATSSRPVDPSECDFE